MELLWICYYYICMTSTKNNKLKCIVTGRQLIATKEYYKRKVEKVGDEQKLHDTYMCREAKNLLKQGTSIDKVRELLGSDITTPVDQDIIDQIVGDDLPEIEVLTLAYDRIIFNGKGSLTSR